jgi:hypothetical protein
MLFPHSHFTVVLSLAKMELENFFKSVMPVADYFDQSELLVAVNVVARLQTRHFR